MGPRQKGGGDQPHLGPDCLSENAKRWTSIRTRSPTMAKGLSIHIGLNRVDPQAYNGWDGVLAGCVKDAQAMRDIATAQGFIPTVILNEQANADRVITELGQAALQLDSGDMLLV